MPEGYQQVTTLFNTRHCISDYASQVIRKSILRNEKQPQFQKEYKIIHYLFNVGPSERQD